MSLEIIGKISVIILLILMFYSFIQKKIEISTLLLFLSILSVIIVVITTPEIDVSELETLFLGFIPLKTIILLISMEIIIKIINQENLFQFFGVKLIHLTHSNPREFYYIISIAIALFSAIMADYPLTLIFIPMILRTTEVLKINPKPYVLGVTLGISLGNLLAPFSCMTNIIFSDMFQLDSLWFLKNATIPFVILLTSSLVFIDLTMIKKSAPPSRYQKALILEIMDPQLLIGDKKKFNMLFAFFVILIGFMLILSKYAYLISIVGLLVLILIENSRKKLPDYLKTIEWKIIVIIIAVFLMIGSLSINGTIEMINNFMIIIIGNDIFITMIIILIFSSLVASITSNGLSLIMFGTILQTIFSNLYLNIQTQDTLLMVLLIGLNLGSFLLPQTATRIIKTYDFIEIFSSNTGKLSRNKFNLYIALYSLAFVLGAILYFSIILELFG